MTNGDKKQSNKTSEEQGISTAPETLEKRSVGVILGLGIFFLPIIFSWFTLAKGRTNLAKGVAFGWLAASVVIVMLPSGEDNQSTSAQLQNEPQVVAAVSVDAEPISLPLGEDNQSTPAQLQNEPQVAAAASVAVEPISTSVERIITEYKTNEIAADDAYQGKVVYVTGLVGGVNKGRNDNYVVSLKNSDPWNSRTFEAFFDNSEKSKLMTIGKESTISIHCEIFGLVNTFEVKGENCGFAE